MKLTRNENKIKQKAKISSIKPFLLSKKLDINNKKMVTNKKHSNIDISHSYTNTVLILKNTIFYYIIHHTIYHIRNKQQTTNNKQQGNK